MLHIKAVEAKNLPVMDVAPGTVDPFLTFRLNSNPSYNLKTKVIKKTFTPHWDEDFHFKVNLGKGEVLHVELFDYDVVSANDLISTHDFELDYFPLGRVVDSWYTFFKAPKAKKKKPGQVHLIFHLANEGDEPFVDKITKSSYLNCDIKVNPLTDDEMQEAREKFKIIDTNRNGLLEESELDSYFRQEKKELRCFPKLIVQLYGTNGAVNADQFFQFYKSLSAPRTSDEFIGRYIFNYIDSDHSGKIDASEYQKVMDLIQIPKGYTQRTLDRVKTMDYDEFSHHFYTVLRIAWGGLFQKTEISEQGLK